MFELITNMHWRRLPAGTGGAARRCIGMLALAALLVSGAVSGARAQSDEDRVFEVRAVAVDVQAATAADAQAKAIVQGRRDAWRRLLDRLVPKSNAAQIPALSDEELVGLTVGYEVARERTSDVRYLGSLNFRFNPLAVRQFFNARGIAYAEVASRPVLILPVYNDGRKPLLWEEESPWLAAWLERGAGDGLVPITVPYGDLADIRDISAVQAVLVDREAIQTIGARYGAAQAVIANARTVTTDAGTQAVELNLIYVGGVADGQSLIRTVAPDAGAAGSDLLAAAAKAAASEIQEAWKTENLISPGLETRVTVLVPVPSFDYWLEVRKGLDGVSSISRREMLRISRTEALIDVWINGDADQLALALKQRGLVLEEMGGNWILYKEGTELPERYRPAPQLQPVLPPSPEPAPAPAQPLILPPLVQ
ncbi:DUF2066 domain-containing protein [Nisaea sediminum]|uniref:DUF2066 domain-containing protein n=1 Tax=Nisaea sediminum TaxID=2775867 RepID=UPI0018668641|nr:DUF2066 domain-containing protein [Nisaea sediminum]